MFSTLSTGLTHTASMRSVEEGHVYLKQRFTEFLDTLHRGSINYHKVIEELLQRGEHRLGIDLNAVPRRAMQCLVYLCRFLLALCLDLSHRSFSPLVEVI